VKQGAAPADHPIRERVSAGCHQSCRLRLAFFPSTKRVALWACPRQDVLDGGDVPSSSSAGRVDATGIEGVGDGRQGTVTLIESLRTKEPGRIGSRCDGGLAPRCQSPIAKHAWASAGDQMALDTEHIVDGGVG
jgi:hypothetical protein